MRKPNRKETDRARDPKNVIKETAREGTREPSEENSQGEGPEYLTALGSRWQEQVRCIPQEDRSR